MAPVWFPPGTGNARPRGPGRGIAGYGETTELPPEVQEDVERLENAIVRALTKIAGIPIRIAPDGWPPFGAQMFDRRTVVAGVTPTASFVQLVSFGPVNQGTNAYLGAYGIGISDPDQRVNMSWRVDLPTRLQSSDWLEVNQLQEIGFPRGCFQVCHFPLSAGEAVGLSARYTAGAVPAGLLIHARLMGWTWLPRVYDPTNYRGRPE